MAEKKGLLALGARKGHKHFGGGLPTLSVLYKGDVYGISLS